MQVYISLIEIDLKIYLGYCSIIWIKIALRFLLYLHNKCDYKSGK